MKIGIIGLGFVGKAVYYGFEEKLGKENILVNDVACQANFPVKICSVNEIANNCEMIFVCVPTPTDIHTGKINTGIVEDVVGKIDDAIVIGMRTVVIKSTVVPGTCRRIQKKNTRVNVVFNPEFLTEKNYIEDFKNQQYIILGGEYEDCVRVRDYYTEGFKKTKAYVDDWEVAEMCKYMVNCMLASKVALCNEFYKICKASNINYNAVKNFVGQDDRIGKSHMAVPGNDFNFGFGGKCFPKDLLALINFAESRQYNPEILKQVWQSNLKFRSDRNWLDIPGAVE